MSEHEVCFNCKHVRYPELRDSFNGDCPACVQWAEHQITAFRAEVAALKAKLNEVQEGEHPFCAYCNEQVAAKTMDDLKAHIMVCPQHPLPTALRLVDELTAKLACYEGPLTDEQLVNISALMIDGGARSISKWDAAIRQVRRERGKS